MRLSSGRGHEVLDVCFPDQWGHAQVPSAFLVYNITKSLIAVLIRQLIQEKHFSLATPLARWMLAPPPRPSRFTIC